MDFPLLIEGDFFKNIYRCASPYDPAWAGLYHCPFEIRLCSGKGGHGRLGRVETGLLSRTLPIGTKGADRSTQARRAVPLYSNPKASGF